MQVTFFTSEICVRESGFIFISKFKSELHFFLYPTYIFLIFDLYIFSSLLSVLCRIRNRTLIHFFHSDSFVDILF